MDKYVVDENPVNLWKLNTARTGGLPPVADPVDEALAVLPQRVPSERRQLLLRRSQPHLRRLSAGKPPRPMCKALPKVGKLRTPQVEDCNIEGDRDCDWSPVRDARGTMMPRWPHSCRVGRWMQWSTVADHTLSSVQLGDGVRHLPAVVAHDLRRLQPVADVGALQPELAQHLQRRHSAGPGQKLRHRRVKTRPRHST